MSTTSTTPCSSRIASLLHRIDYIEKVGTGIIRIRQSVAEHGGTELELRYNDFFTATFQAKGAVAGEASVTTAGVESGAESQVQKILSQLRDTPLSKSELALKVGLKTVSGALNRSVNELLDKEIIERTIPEKPNSRLQKYRLTEKGRTLLRNENGDE